jgi:hypothetical protein
MLLVFVVAFIGMVLAVPFLLPDMYENDGKMNSGGSSAVADDYGYYEDAEDVYYDESVTMIGDGADGDVRGPLLQFQDNSIRTFSVPGVVPPVIDDDYVNITQILFGCRPSETRRREREEARETARRKRTEEDETATKRNAIQNKLGRRMVKRDREEVFSASSAEEAVDANNGLFFFGFDAETNFSSYNSSDELINASIAAKSQKKISFRKAYETRIKHQLNENVLRESQFLKHDLGPSCEELTCASCKLFVDESVSAIRSMLGTDNCKFAHVGSALLYSDICSSEQFQIDFKPFASMLCLDYISNVGYTATYIFSRLPLESV